MILDVSRLLVVLAVVPLSSNPVYAADVVVTTATSATTSDSSRKVEIVNESGKKLVVDWINPQSGEVHSLTEDFPNGAKQVINSFINHTLLIHEPTTSPTCDVIDEDCGVGYVTISEDVEHVVVVKEDLKVVDFQEPTPTPPQLSAAQNEANTVTRACQQDAFEDLNEGRDADMVLKELVDCIKETATKMIVRKNEHLVLEKKVRLELSAALENYTCADTTRETTTPEEIRSWTHEDTAGVMVTRQIGILHNRKASQIHALENFISKEECDAITEAAAAKLHRGTVADGSGGSRLSDHRKAWQAGLRVPWEKENEGNLIARVVRRVYDYTNDAVH